MDAPLPDPDGPLPTDVTALQALVRALLAEVVRLRAENAELKTKLDAATKHRFGRRSERKKSTPADPRAGATSTAAIRCPSTSNGGT